MSFDGTKEKSRVSILVTPYVVSASNSVDDTRASIATENEPL
jgi:hypothetical protein